MEKRKPGRPKLTEEQRKRGTRQTIYINKVTLDKIDALRAVTGESRQQIIYEAISKLLEG
jgi:hypothetical protein|tara:strand:+ start:446 stop:625 length:180 start_codon:yes stop_codon:yes gene_type:complete